MIELCPRCKRPLSTKEVGHVMCRQCAEVDLAKALGDGILALPDDWYPPSDIEEGNS